MGINLKWLKAGLKIIGKISGAIQVVEKIAEGVPNLKGKSKSDAALVLAEELIDELGGPYGALMRDPRVRADAEAFMAAAVKLQNTLAEVAREQDFPTSEA